MLTPNTMSVKSDSGSISLNNNKNANITITDNTNSLVIYPQYLQLPVLDKFPKDVTVGAICCKTMQNDDMLKHLWWFNGKNWIMFA